MASVMGYIYNLDSPERLGREQSVSERVQTTDFAMSDRYSVHPMSVLS